MALNNPGFGQGGIGLDALQVEAMIIDKIDRHKVETDPHGNVYAKSSDLQAVIDTINQLPHIFSLAEITDLIDAVAEIAINSAIAAHVAELNPHSQYLTESNGGGGNSGNGGTGSNQSNEFDNFIQIDTDGSDGNYGKLIFSQPKTYDEELTVQDVSIIPDPEYYETDIYIPVAGRMNPDTNRREAYLNATSYRISDSPLSNPLEGDRWTNQIDRITYIHDGVSYKSKVFAFTSNVINQSDTVHYPFPLLYESIEVVGTYGTIWRDSTQSSSSVNYWRILFTDNVSERVIHSFQNRSQNRFEFNVNLDPVLIAEASSPRQIGIKIEKIGNPLNASLSFTVLYRYVG
jgi:hypothetical protein